MAGTMIRRPERASGIPEVLRQPKVLNGKPRFSTEVVIRVGGLPARIPGLALPDPDYVKFDRALQTSVRPVLVSLQRSPFRDFSADEFLGPVLLSCRPPGGCRSAFQGSPITLGQIADAVVYFGNR